jgi:Reeler domain
MRNTTGKTTTLKLLVISAFAALAIVVSFLDSDQKARASALGPSPSHTNAPGESNCTECHIDFPVNSGTGSVRISGVPRIYYPNQQIPVKVTTSQEDGVVYGFQMTAIDSQGRPAGTWTLPDAVQTQIVQGFVGQNLRQYVEHTFQGIVPTEFGSKSWTIVWNAPPQQIGRVSFHAAGNAANGNGETSGDFIYTTARYSVGGSAAADAGAASR